MTYLLKESVNEQDKNMKTQWEHNLLSSLQLNEGINAGAWEFVIAYAYNELSNKNTESIEEFSGGAVTEKAYLSVEDSALKIAQKLHRALSSKEYMKKLPTSGISTVEWWKGNDKTPKTDIISGKKAKVSLKAVGGSQLMSSGGAETASTIIAAMKLSDQYTPKGESLAKFIEKSLINFKAPENAAIGTITSTAHEYRHLIDQGNTKAAQKLLKDSGKDIARSVLSYLEIDDTKEQIGRKLITWLNDDSDFRKWFVFEAATGSKKFEPSPSAAANYIAAFDPNSGTVDVHSLTNGNKPSSYINSLSEQVSFRVSWKTSSSKASSSRLTFRAVLKEELNGLDTMLLNESVTDTVNMMITWVKNLWNKILNYIIKVAKQGIEAFVDFIGLDIESASVSGLPIF